jgi:hypothetical protein
MDIRLLMVQNGFVVVVKGGMNMDDIFSQFGDIFGSTLAEVADWWQAEVNRTKGSNLHIKRN